MDIADLPQSELRSLCKILGFEAWSTRSAKHANAHQSKVCPNEALVSGLFLVAQQIIATLTYNTLNT